MQSSGQRDFSLSKLVIPKLLDYSCYVCPLYYLRSRKVGKLYRWICEFVGVQGMKV